MTDIGIIVGTQIDDHNIIFFCMLKVPGFLVFWKNSGLIIVLGQNAVRLFLSISGPAGNNPIPTVAYGTVVRIEHPGR